MSRDTQVLHISCMTTAVEGTNMSPCLVRRYRISTVMTVFCVKSSTRLTYFSDIIFQLSLIFCNLEVVFCGYSEMGLEGGGDF